MDKVLVVCGPTATGKTKLALQLAEKFDGEIISADSRQVYKYFDIVTGKDIPPRFKRDGEYYSNGEIRIWGYDIAEPNDDFSSKLYADYAREVIADIRGRGKLPILEGGTGFYIDVAVKNFEHIDVPQNKELREKYEELTVDQLYAMLMKVDPQRALSVNESDRKNKRRLLRILEKIDFELRGYALEDSDQKELYEILWIGLTYENREELYRQIDNRVDSRIGDELTKEVHFLKENNYFEKAQATTPGYKYWDEPEKWKQSEHNYAKRQITWFKRNNKINWFDPSADNFQSEVEALVSKWYSNSNAEEN